MNLRLTFLASSLALAAAAGCYTGSAVDTGYVPTTTFGESQPENPGTEETVTETEESAVDEKAGLPCDISVLLKASCGSCHGPKREDADRIQIATYEDLVAAPPSSSKKTLAELSLSRMKSTENPMPPNGKLGTDEIAILEKWIKDGMPKGSCGTTTDAKTDGGKKPAKKDSGTPEPEPQPEPEPTSVCTSGVTAPAGFGPTMQPGKACINCHTAQSGPSFTVAGTVFPTKHEPDNCNGSDGPTEGTKVLIIDANGSMRSLNVNASGNFMSSTALPTPYRAIVVKGNSIREMKSTQTNGDCNSCHSEFGKNGAPGRVMEP